MARPRKKVDAVQLEKLAAINCSLDEMGAVLGCSADTLGRRFADVIKRGRETGKASLKRTMWDAAMNKGNITMMIWLSKQLLGYRDRFETVNQNINTNSDKTDAELNQEAQLLANRNGFVLKSKEEGNGG